MALSLAQQADIFISAQATIRGVRGTPDLGNIAARLLHRFTDNDPANYLPVLNQVRNASRAVNAARSTRDEPERRIPAAQHAVDPSLTELGYRFGYRVVVVADPRDGREPVETLILITSDTTLSPDEVRARAAQAYSSMDFAPRYVERFRRVGPAPTVEFFIVGVGRSR